MDKLKQLVVSVAVFLGLFVSGQALASKLADQSGSDEPLGSRSIMSPAKIDARTQPAAKVCLQGEDCASAQPAVAAGSEEAKSPEEIYNTTCAACHGTGVAGAPKVGDKAGWTSRIAQGNETMYTHAIKGLNAMPPMGTCATCSEDDIKAVVDYMVSESK
ncbi:cytochrome c5 family protein [Ketobacter sp. MCCC 1A13808]|uniref:c-type cytochrome n=1 Tax=Ketobacter sp. MCCC 1A13808 TaxID=2602738 RepID=UPI000F1E0C7C|nr:c-type cytochrome [Ketobacter sp. MCCC 1A13808]MVF12361.1 cytochrome c5 family protein [Ketobacter sp. MCCC 1A13808]RLP55164.1 MAG: cytochrome c5 family protein [Ketobacter sp.]